MREGDVVGQPVIVNAPLPVAAPTVLNLVTAVLAVIGVVLLTPLRTLIGFGTVALAVSHTLSELASTQTTQPVCQVGVVEQLEAFDTFAQTMTGALRMIASPRA